jgi:hypothetical protein
MANDWRNRIIGTDVKPAIWFLANESKWRIHPISQQEALVGILHEVGWVQDVIVNRRTDPSWGTDQGVETLIDGHLRVSLALRESDETPIPLTYVDLTRDEENLILASFDPIAALAIADKEKLDALLRETSPADLALQQMLSELAAKEGLYTENGGRELTGMTIENPIKDEVRTCPECGAILG